MKATGCLFPEDIWIRFAGPLKLPLSARDEVASAIETYRALADYDRNALTGAERRARLLKIAKLAEALANAIALLGSSLDLADLSELRGIDISEISPANAHAVLMGHSQNLIRYQIELRDAAEQVAKSVPSTKSGADASNLHFLVHFLDDLLIRHTGKGLRVSNDPLSFAIRVFKIADHQRKKTSERAIKDAVAFFVKHRSQIPSRPFP